MPSDAEQLELAAEKPRGHAAVCQLWRWAEAKRLAVRREGAIFDRAEIPRPGPVKRRPGGGIPVSRLDQVEPWPEVPNTSDPAEPNPEIRRFDSEWSAEQQDQHEERERYRHAMRQHQGQSSKVPPAPARSARPVARERRDNTTRSSARSRDPGDDGAGEPPPALAGAPPRFSRSSRSLTEAAWAPRPTQEGATR